MKDHKEMGRFSVEFAVANYGEVVRLPRGQAQFWRMSSMFVVSGVVDSGAARLVLPQHVVGSTWNCQSGRGNQRPLR